MSGDHINLTPLNYITHAIEDFTGVTKAIGYHNPLEFPHDRHNRLLMKTFFEFLTELLSRSVKFTLPDNGKLVDGDAITETKLGLLRLPYPVVALEFSAPDMNNNVSELNLPSTKRIALAMDLDKLTATDRARMTQLMPAFEKLAKPERIGVFSIYHAEGSGWGSSLGLTIINREEELALKKGPNGKNMLGLPTDNCLLSIMSESEQAHLDLLESLSNDSIDEVIVTINFCAIMNCNNVSTALIPASEKLNKKRIANGKIPLSDYHVLVLNPNDPKSDGYGANAGSHASPRMHLRRGHIRRLTDGRVTWVNAAVVNNKSEHKVSKSYQVKV